MASLDIHIVLGDFNAKIGKENVYKPTIGNESLHNETNDNGMKMVQFAVSKGLNIRSTTFPHTDIHKETWYSADGRTANQIDHVLISNRLRSAITDIRALRGTNILSDHNLLKIHFKVKLRVKAGNKNREERKIVNMLQIPDWKKEYATEIHNRFEILTNMEEEGDADKTIDVKWENIKTIIKETKQKIVEKDGGAERLRNQCYDEECKTAIEEMKRAQERWLIKGRRENEEQEYHHKRKEAQKVIRNKKKTYSVLSIYRPRILCFLVFTVRHIRSRIKSHINNVIFSCIHRFPELPFSRIYRCK
jgi:hypothetical protein